MNGVPWGTVEMIVINTFIINVRGTFNNTWVEKVVQTWFAYISHGKVFTLIELMRATDQFVPLAT